MMEHIVCSSDALYEQVGQELVRRISDSTKPCLVLLSGGSAIRTYKPLKDLIARGRAGHVMVGLVDERYGRMGHANSNAQAIEEATSIGEICQQMNVVYRPILTGTHLAEEARLYERWIAEAFALCPVRLAVLGVGVDGHTAGILPMPRQSFDSIFSSHRMVVGYESDDNFAARITLTPRTLRQLTGAVVVAAGAEKRPVVDRLLGSTEVETCRFPAGIIQSIPNVRLFTD